MAGDSSPQNWGPTPQAGPPPPPLQSHGLGRGQTAAGTQGGCAWGQRPEALGEPGQGSRDGRMEFLQCEFQGKSHLGRRKRGGLVLLQGRRKPLRPWEGTAEPSATSRRRPACPAVTPELTAPPAFLVGRFHTAASDWGGLGGTHPLPQRGFPRPPRGDPRIPTALPAPGHPEPSAETPAQRTLRKLQLS